MKYFSLIAVMLAGLLTGGASLADTAGNAKEAPPGSPIHDYLYSKKMFEKMTAIAMFIDQQLAIECGSQYDIKPRMFFVLEPIDLPSGRAHPTGGAWSYRYDAVRCGTNRTYNMLAVAENAKEPKVIPLFPGNSLASLLLQRDASTNLAAYLGMQVGGGCDGKIMVFDISVAKRFHTMRFDRTPSTEKLKLAGKSVDGVWEENWVFRACSKNHVVSVRFVPDGMGGTHILPLGVTKGSP